MIKNIIFDFGGVLYDIRYQSIAEAFAQCGVQNVEQLYSKKHQAELFDLFEEGKISPAEFRDGLRAQTDVALSDEQFDACWNAILVDFPVEHEQMLKRIKPNYRLFLYSNTNQINYDCFMPVIRQKFGYDLVATFFEKSYFSQLLQIRKPKAEGYQYIIDENHLVPEETLFIDDSPQNLSGAVQCGMRTYHLKDGEDVAMLFDEQGRLLESVLA